MCNYNGGTNVRELFSFPAQHSEINFNLLLKLHIEYNIKKKTSNINWSGGSSAFYNSLVALKN